MSEPLRRIKEHAKQKGQSVTLVSRQLGVEVYRHPKGVNVRQLSNRRRERYFSAWLLELTDHCVC
jgi:hypothetical protein